MKLDEASIDTAIVKAGLAINKITDETGRITWIDGSNKMAAFLKPGDEVVSALRGDVAAASGIQGDVETSKGVVDAARYKILRIRWQSQKWPAKKRAAFIVVWAALFVPMLLALTFVSSIMLDTVESSIGKESTLALLLVLVVAFSAMAIVLTIIERQLKMKYGQWD